MAFGEEISDIYVNFLDNLKTGVVDFFWAIVVLVLGYLIAVIVAFIVHKILVRMKIDKRMEKAKLADAIGKMEISHLAASLVKWYIFIIFIGQAATLIKLEDFSSLVMKFVEWLPDLILGIAILLVGLIFADFIAQKLSASRVKSVRWVSIITKVLIMFFVFVIALSQIGLEVQLASDAFLIVLGSLGLGTAIALGIGFGGAFKDEAKNIIGRIKNARP